MAALLVALDGEAADAESVARSVATEFGIDASQVAVHPLPPASSRFAFVADVGRAHTQLSVGLIKDVLAENRALRARLAETTAALVTLNEALAAASGSPPAPQAAASGDAAALRTRNVMLEEQARELGAQVAMLRRKAHRTETFRSEILQTVRTLQRDLATLSEDANLSGWSASAVDAPPVA